MTKLFKGLTIAAALLSGTAALAEAPKVGAAVYGLAAILFGAVRLSDIKGMRRGRAT